MSNIQENIEIIISSFKIAQRLVRDGYYGPFGFDFVIDEENISYIVEANVRLNYSHCMLDLVNAIGGKYALLTDLYSTNRTYKNMDGFYKQIDV